MLLLCIEKCHSGAWSVAAVANCGAVFRRLGFVAFERSRQHALRGAAPASPATETQGHGPGLHPARGDERPRRASRQRQGPRALLEAPLMARHHQAHIRQRCLRPSALGDFCIHDARLKCRARWRTGGARAGLWYGYQAVDVPRMSAYFRERTRTGKSFERVIPLSQLFQLSAADSRAGQTCAPAR